MIEAFRLLSGSNMIEVEKLENWLRIYDKKYKNNVIYPMNLDYSIHCINKTITQFQKWVFGL